MCGGTTLDAKFARKLHLVVWKWPKVAKCQKSFLAQNGQIWGHFHTTGCIFLTSFAPRLVLPHVFNCDPPFDPFLPAIWGVCSLSWPKTVIQAPNGPLWSHFHTTGCVILTSFAPRLVLLHVFNCDPPFDPLLPAIWGVWSLSWPKTVVLAKKRAFFGHNSTKSGKIGVLEVDLQSTQYI